MSNLLTGKEVAKKLGISEFTVNYKLAGFEFNYVKVLNKRRYREEDIENYIKRNTVLPMIKIEKLQRNYII